MSAITPPKIGAGGGGTGGSAFTTTSTLTGGSSSFLAEVLKELGSETCDHGTFTDILQQLSPKLKGPPLERNVASALAMMLNDGGSATTIDHQWNIKGFATACLETFKSVDINRVMASLQETPLVVSDAAMAVRFVQTLTFFDKKLYENLDIETFFTPWKNPTSQLRLILCLLALPTEVFSFTSFKSNEPVIKLADYNGSSPTILQLADSLTRCTWNCLLLFRFVANMIDSEYFDDAKPIFELASRQCAELLSIALACLDPSWTSINKEILVKLTCGFLLGQPSSQLVLPRIWALNPNLFLFCMVEIFRRDSSCLPRLLDVSQELKILPVLLDAKPYSFTLELAGLAARRDVLNLEKWLTESFAQRGEAFIKECIAFLCQKVTFLKDNPTSPGANELYVTLVAVHGQLLRLPPRVLREFTDMLRECGNVLSQFRGPTTSFSAVMGTDYGTAMSGTLEGFEPELEEETNAIFDRIFAREITIPEVLEILRRQRHSPNMREHQLFNCFLHNLFDEYRFFSKYPESELSLTAILFGQIIDSSLLSGLPALQVALRCVLEALKKPTTQKLFKFGIQALAQFHSKIRRWPQFCQQLLALAHLREEYPDLYTFVEGEAQVSLPTSGTGSDWEGKEDSAVATPGNSPTDEVESPAAGTNPLLKIIDRDNLTSPADGTRDRILFIINNLSSNNLEKKANDLVRILEENHFAWLAQYLVIRRASLEPNYHALYLEFLETLQVKALEGHVLNQTYSSIYVLLESPRIVSSSAERSLLKNLGSWLGSLTLARNRPILYRDLCLKELLLEAFSKDLLVAVLPFVCKIMEKAAQSIAFRPENPWLMALLRLLAELYTSERLKLNLKFEIEVLGKALAVDIGSLEPTKLLLTRRPTIDSLSPYATREIANLTHPLMPLLLKQYHHPSGTLAANSRLLVVVAYAIEWAVREYIHSSLHPALEGAVRSAIASTLTDLPLSSRLSSLDGAGNTMAKFGMDLAKSILASTVPWTFRDFLKTSMIDYLHYLSRHPNSSTQVTTPWIADQIESLAEEHLEVAGLLLEKAALDLAVPLVPTILKNLASVNRDTTWNAEQIQALYQSLVAVTDRLKSLPCISYNPLEENELYEIASTLPPLPLPSTGTLHSSNGISAKESHIVSPTNPNLKAVATITPTSTDSMESASLDAYFENVCTKFVEMMASLERSVLAIKDKNIDSITKLPASHEIRSLMKQIILLASSSPIHRDELCLLMSQRFMQSLYRTDSPLFVDVVILLLIKVFEFSAKAAKEVTTWVIHSTDERKYSVLATLALFASGLVYVLDFDGQLARQIETRKGERVVWFAIELIRACVFGEKHVAAPYDFVFSLEALSKLLNVSGNHDDGEVPLEKDLQVTISSLLKDIAALVKAPQPESQLLRDQITFCFTDWFRLCQYPSLNDKLIASFVSQLLHRKFLADEESARLFFQICTELAIELYVRQRRTPAILAYRSVDAFARLLESVFFLHPSWGAVRDEEMTTVLGPANLLDPLRILTIFHSVVGLLLVQGLEQGLTYLQKPFTRLLVATCNGLVRCRESKTNANDVPSLGTDDVDIEGVGGGVVEGVRWQVIENLATFYLLISPRNCPTFMLGWLEVVGSRALLSSLLEDESRGWPILHTLLAEYLAVVGPQLLGQPDCTEATRTLYKGLVRLALVILHDGAEFLVSKGRSLATLVPPGAVQLKNVFLAALPSSTATSSPNFPDPTCGLPLTSFVKAPLDVTSLTRLRDDLLTLSITGVEMDGELDTLNGIISYLIKVREEGSAEFALVNRLIALLQIQQILTMASNSNGIDPETMTNAWIPGGAGEQSLLYKVCHHIGLSSDSLTRYALLISLVDGLTIPTSPLTHLNYHLIMRLFTLENEQLDYTTVDDNSTAGEALRETIVRCLLERLIVHRPHAWGVMYTLIQLVRQRDNNGLFELRGIKAYPELQRIFDSIVKSCTSNNSASNSNPSITA